MADIMPLIQKLMTYGPAIKKMTPREVNVRMLQAIATSAGMDLDFGAVSRVQALIAESGAKNVYTLLGDAQFQEKLAAVLDQQQPAIEVDSMPQELILQCPYCFKGFMKTLG